MIGTAQGGEHPLMTLRQAAEHTGLSATTLRRYIKSGRLRARLIPGRYGPEYVVTEDDLGAARLLDGPGAGLEVVSDTLAHGGLATSSTASADLVPGLMFRELTMKHEQLLVQYGMLRVSGQQLYELRQEAERRAREAEEATSELSRIRDRHAREIGELKARQRQAELALAEKDDEVRQLRAQVLRAEIAQRNAQTAQSIDSQFARAVAGPPADH